jgi:purine-binding chemotaxis protein CheW
MLQLATNYKRYSGVKWMNKELVIEQSDSENDKFLQYLTYSLDEEIYGINIMQVQEVLRYREISPVPGSPNCVLGIINLRGNEVTVIDNRLRFGLIPGEVTNNTRIIIMELESIVTGILVDSVAEIVYLKSSEIDSASNIGLVNSAQFIQGVSHREDGLLFLVNLNTLFTQEK